MSVRQLNTKIRKAVPVGELAPHPDNPREGDVGAIHESISEHGFYGVIVAQESTGRILAGNHRWQAAKAAGLDKVPVAFVDVDDDEALRILLADNRTTDLATYDKAKLSQLLSELAASDRGFGGTGFDGDDLDSMLKELGDAARDGAEGYTQRIESPIYEPVEEEPPPVEELYDTSAYDELVDAIDRSKVPEEVKAFLRHAAARHIEIDFQACAEFYAHASKPVQRLMEDSALVIVDFGQAVERGFVRLNHQIESLWKDEHPDA